MRSEREDLRGRARGLYTAGRGVCILFARCERKPLAGFKRKGVIGFTFCQVVNI